MKSAPLPQQEQQRLEALRSLDVLDSEPEAEFDALARAASLVCDTPVSLISLVDSERQWFKANIGLPGVAETPRDIAFCSHAIHGDDLFEVLDATLDPRFAGNPLVTGQPDIRFYAGAPLRLSDGSRVGTLCVIDRRPRRLGDTEREILRNLAIAAAHALESRRGARLQALAASALTRSEARFRALSDGSPLGVYGANLAGRCTYVNRRCQLIYGRSVEECLGTGWLAALHPADREHVSETWQRCVAALGEFDMEFRICRPDGTVRVVHSQARPALADAGDAPSYIGSMEDITERHDMLARLAASEERLRRLYEATPAMMHSIDAQGRLLTVSDRWLERLGYSREEVIGRPSADFLTPRSRELANRVVLPAFFASGHCDQIEYQMVARDGAVVDVLLSAILDRTGDGEALRSLAIIEDLTLRRQAEADRSLARDQLEKSEARYRAIVEDQTELLSLAEVGGTLLFVNQAYARHFGMAAEEMIGRNLLEFVDAADRDAVVSHLKSVVESGRSDVGINRSMSAHRGPRWIAWTNRPIPGTTSGSPTVIHSVGRDITEQRLAEARLQEALAEKETLLKEVYHRVKNNLQVVQSLLSLQHRTVSDDAARTALSESARRIRAMALVHEKLYQSGNLSAVSLREYTLDLLRQVDEAAGAQERRLRLHAEVEDIESGLDNAIPFGLLVTELVFNAFEHGFANRQRGEIRVELKRRGTTPWLTISDDGVGLCSGFQLAGGSTMGLQLAISLARQLGGELEAHNDGGAVFSAGLSRL